MIDPRNERTKLLTRKDAPLEGSWLWVLDDPAYRRWKSNDDIHLLWIHGDPGKGKTMMTIALIDELARGAPKDGNSSDVIVYFFCQSAAEGLDSAAGVLRGLLYGLITEHEDILRLVQQEYDVRDQRLFEGPTAMFTLWTVLCSALQRFTRSRIYLMVDAVDECRVQQQDLLKLITSSYAASLQHVKWLLTSRNEPIIRERLEHGSHQAHTSLELNSDPVSRAVESYVAYKAQDLAQRKSYNEVLKHEVMEHLRTHAEGTFLWVALACQELEKVAGWKTKALLREFPAGLEPLYTRMLEQMANIPDDEYVGLCYRTLRIMTIAQRPLTLKEIAVLGHMQSELCDDMPSMHNLASSCGSFLTIRNGVVYFVHQSARDFLRLGAGMRIFDSSIEDEHLVISRRCVDIMWQALKKDICDLKMPGILVDEIDQSAIEQHLPGEVQYACTYWVHHLFSTMTTSSLQTAARDTRWVYEFLRRHLLHWIEALSLIGQFAKGIHSIVRLHNALQVSNLYNAQLSLCTNVQPQKC